MEPHQEGSASEDRLRDRISGGAFAVALSGGGHRATLATLGALLALVDRGLAPRILQVASVSGGSITNAFVAQRAHLEALGPEGLDDIATELATTIIRKGVLTVRWIVVTILTPVIVGIAAGVILRRTIVPWAWLTVAIGAAIAFAGLLGRGLVVDWLLDRRYFRRTRLVGARTRRERARFASLSGRRIDHVLCATDIALGLPVYASTQHGGVIWRAASVPSGEVLRLADDYRESAWGAEQIRATDPSVTEWEQATSSRVRLARAHTQPDNKIDKTDWLAYVLGAKEPEGSFPVCGLASFDDWEALRTSPDWKKLVTNDGAGPVGAPTTLGRFEAELARRLIARAYLNTYLVSIFLAPLIEGDLERLARLPARLDKIVGRA